MYYILSLKHTNKTDASITLWRYNNSGYTWLQKYAGVYEEIKDGYHNTFNDSLPVSKEYLDKFFIEGQIPNCELVWRILGLEYKKGNLVRK